MSDAPHINALQCILNRYGSHIDTTQLTQAVAPVVLDAEVLPCRTKKLAASVFVHYIVVHHARSTITPLLPLLALVL